MKAGRFFSVHYDTRHNPKIELLRDMGGGLLEFGRWMVLLALLYDSDGLYDITSKSKKRYLMRELECGSDEELDKFLSNCAECELISQELLELGHIVSRGVSEEIDYHKTKSEAGKKGMQKRWGKKAESNS